MWTPDTSKTNLNQLHLEQSIFSTYHIPMIETQNFKGNIFLVGCMGAGKTTIGRQLSKHFKIPFFDSDHEIEKRTGVKIPVIFDIEGETGFRDRETHMLDELTQKDGIVLSTGGGAVLREQNRQFLMSRGQVIYLRAPVHQLFQRTRRDKNRPLLQTDNPKARLRELVKERDPIYSKVADLIVNTEHRTVKHIIHEIYQNIQ